MDAQSRYEGFIASEKLRYENCADVHELPEIFHYWSNRYIRPKLIQCGFSTPNEVFEKYLAEQCNRDKHRPHRFVSLGSGNCDLEIDLALKLRAHGPSHFIFECLDLNPAMLDRGRRAAHETGLADHLTFAQSDLNSWSAAHEYDAAIANYSLHHVVNLENLFNQVKRSLRPGAPFIVADMIGRNGHQRWPEALGIVHEFWRKLPPSYRFNRLSGLYEELYEDQDCSLEGFEGIRSQDILPLLLDRFHFRLFIPFANIVDPFVDRTFGPNFDVAFEWDRAFIDQVHHRDEEELSAGRVKPTHMFAVVANEPCDSPVLLEHLTPKFCVRPAAAMHSDAAPGVHGAYESQTWPPQELEKVCRRLAESSKQSRRESERAHRLEKELEERTTAAFQREKKLEEELAERTTWAFEAQERLEKELEQRTAWARGLENQLEEKTAWALRLKEELRELEQELEARTASVLSLEQDLGERTAWALRLDKELKERTAWALDLERNVKEQTAELQRHARNPIRYAAGRLVNRIRRS